MAINTKTSMAGFVVSTPQLSRSQTDQIRMYMRVGQEHVVRNPDGSFTQLDSSFHDLVVFGRTGERAATQFAKGDRFIAEGRINSHAGVDETGQPVEREEFIASKIGHDVAFTNYAVDRTPRQTHAQTVETAQPSVSVPMIQQGPTNQVDAPFRVNEPAPVSM